MLGKNKGEAKHPQAGKDAGSPGIRRPRDGFEGKPSLVILLPLRAKVAGIAQPNASAVKAQTGYSAEAPSIAFPTACRLDLTRRSCAFHQAATAAMTSSHSEVGKSAAAILTT
jgi:hypothetical protein